MIRAPAVLLALALSAGPAAAIEAPTPFQPDLLRLAEILGALTYLDTLCGTPDADLWRSRMQAIIDGQKMSPEDRRLYVDVFNRGHRTFASVHRSCTDQTRFVVERYLAEGAAIAARVDERFGRGTASSTLPGR